MINLATDFALFVLIVGAPKLIAVMPRRLVNVPNKSYWLLPENLERAQAKLRPLLYEIGFAVYLVLFAAGALASQANRKSPVRFDHDTFLVVLAAFAVFMIYWTVKTYRAFRIPG